MRTNECNKYLENIETKAHGCSVAAQLGVWCNRKEGKRKGTNK